MVIYKSALKIWVLLKLLFFLALLLIPCIVSQPKTVVSCDIFSKFLLLKKISLDFIFLFQNFLYFLFLTDNTKQIGFEVRYFLNYLKIP